MKKVGGQPGNPGGGRKTARVERADGELLMRVFFDPQTKAKLKKEIDSGRYSICSKMLLMALDGNQPFIKMIFSKIFPDNVNVNLQNTKILFDLEAETKRILSSLNPKKNEPSKSKPSNKGVSEK